MARNLGQNSDAEGASNKGPLDPQTDAEMALEGEGVDIPLDAIFEGLRAVLSASESAWEDESLSPGDT